jgi:nucleoside-diphosphate-sugar epimerase
MARVLVLGGTRFLGPPVVQALLEAGHEVTVFHRGSSEPASIEGAEHIHAEFSALPDHMAAFAVRQPEVVLDVVPYIDKGGHGIRHFRGIADRAVAITSLDVYRAFAVAWGTEGTPLESMPLTEDAAIRAGPAPDLTDDIDFDNVEVENALGGDSSLPVSVLRLPILYGPHDPQRRLSRYVRRMEDKRDVIILDARAAARRWSRTYIENAAVAVCLAVTDPRATGRTFNVGSVDTPTEAQWVAAIAEVLEWNGEVIALPSDQLPESLRSQLQTDQDLIVATDRLRELGYQEPVGFRDGLLRTIDWERQQELAEASPDYAAEDQVLASRDNETLPHDSLL